MNLVTYCVTNQTFAIFQVQKMWNIAIKPKRTTPAQLENGGYGLGWAVFSEMVRNCVRGIRYILL